MQLGVVDGLFVFEIVFFSVCSGKVEGRRFIRIISLRDGMFLESSI
jgi:hypothetical protein